MTDRDPTILSAIVAAELARGWRVEDRGFWRLAVPDGYPMPVQGWKLHVSATMLSAPLVLSRVARVLVRQGCAFKYPATLDDYWELLSPHSDRAQAGKFIAAYPTGDAESVRLAALLDEATRGLPGPAVLSDRAYRPGGVVHYRYGAFTGVRTLGEEGFYDIGLRTPEGEPVRDERPPRYAPPPFAASPFDPPPEPPAASRPQAVLLDDRYVVREAIRHGNRGGVYLALDTVSAREVIVKEGRPHACSDLSGADARVKLAAEHHRLESLAGTDSVPAVVGLFEQGGHAFLVQELVPGTTLRRWSESVAAPLGGDGFGGAAADVLPVARRLVRKLMTVHDRGLVLVDMSPDNVMVLPGGDLRLIDLEFAALPGDTAMIGGTPGFMAPELVPHRGTLRAAPPRSADLYGLGAMLYFLATGSSPGLMEGAAPARVAEHVRAVCRANPTLALLRPLIEGLLAEPDERWPLDRCARFLDRPPEAGHVPPPAGPDRLDELIGDGLAWLAETMDPGRDAQSPWNDRIQGLDADPCSAGNGAAGILAVLPRSGAEATIAARWLRRRLAAEAVWPPGLYMGRSGALWALYESGEREFALRAARELPTAHPSPDITHGLAGCGMAVLRLALLSGDPVLREQAETTFGNLYAAGSRTGDGLRWASPDSDLAEHLGFAHGVAGIATALLYASQALDRPDWMPAVHEVAALLGEHADLDGGAAWWPTLRGDPSTAWPRRPHWCSGSSGIGAFLVRYWRVTGDAAALSLAEQAAVAVHRSRWKHGAAACHGLPGEGEFLLDMAAFTGEERYRRWAGDLAGCLAARAVRKSGRLLVPDPFDAFVPGYLGGTAGVLAFLLRLRHGHDRIWMLDDVVELGRSATTELAAVR
ncbi:class IV lanthionine synthetase LanL [Nonomuraea sp. LPB2021202275-12-8]|uniref:class IV lanthionine synthetase LanL n=1 Tax=Nonomuraea sp. LPB2021202275-12-8 TaxID=3120159 RepID=UPI00300DB28B